MVYSLLRNAARNADVGRFDLKIFEAGRTFIGMGEGSSRGSRTVQRFLTTGRRYEERWHFRICRRTSMIFKGASNTSWISCGYPPLIQGRHS